MSFFIFNKNPSNSGLGLLEVVVASAIGAIIIYGISGALGRFYSTQQHLNLSTELTEQLKNIRLRADCSASMAGVDFATVPTEGQPIELKSYPSGATMIGLNGSTIDDKFSFLADVKPDRTISIRAALLSSPLSNPRSQLSADASAFKKHPLFKSPWDFAYSENFITKNAPSLNSICGSSATATGAGNVQTNCHLISGNTLACIVVNPVNGAVCSFANSPAITNGGSAHLGLIAGTLNASPPGSTVNMDGFTSKELAKCTKLVTGQMVDGRTPVYSP